MNSKTLIIITHFAEQHALDYGEIQSKEHFDEFTRKKPLDKIRPELDWKSLTEEDAYRIQDVLNQWDFRHNTRHSSSECDEDGEYDDEWEEFDEESENADNEYLVRLIVHRE